MRMIEANEAPVVSESPALTRPDQNMAISGCYSKTQPSLPPPSAAS